MSPGPGVKPGTPSLTTKARALTTTEFQQTSPQHMNIFPAWKTMVTAAVDEVMDKEAKEVEEAL
jgi:hypothetical protein